MSHVKACLLVALALCGCDATGRSLPQWTLEVEGGARAVVVVLPSNFARHMPLREVDYLLHASVPLSTEERGRPLALALDCFHGPISLTVNGVEVRDSGDPAVGVRRFEIGRELTGGESLALSFAVHRDFRNLTGFGVAPRLTLAPDDPRGAAIASFDRYSSVAAVAIMLLLTFLYGLFFLLDRRSENAAVSLWAFFNTIVPLMQLGVPNLLGAIGPRLIPFAAALNYLAYLNFLHRVFDLGRITRWWGALISLFVLARLATIGSFSGSLVFAVAGVPLNLGINIYGLVCLARAARRPEKRVDAMILFAISLPSFFLLIGEISWGLTGIALYRGAHPFGLMIALLGVAQAFVVSRQHVERQRALEAATRELQRQVVERSRQLAETLARLDQPRLEPVGPGATLDGRYRVVRKLGKGGMGAVHEVERISDGRRLALKTLRGRVDAPLMARFAREAQIAAGLHHANLVAVLDVGVTQGGTLFLVMELVDGPSLEGERKRFGDAAWGLPLLGQIAAGLAAIHERGIVHRDLKPGNVLLDRGVARIADFGLASLGNNVDEDAEAMADTAAPASPLTRTGAIFGTPAYMAPEQTAGVGAPLPATDVFAFGILAYEVLTGRAPFAEPPLLARLNGRTIVPAAPLPAGAIAAETRALLERCVAIEPGARPSSSELAAALGAEPIRIDAAR